MTPNELHEWQSSWLYFLRKVTYHNGSRRLVLKSPPHTARIRVILDMFPDAQFVTIHRHPHDVFRSLVSAWPQVIPWWQFQHASFTEDEVIRDYAEIENAYFAQRELIPPENLCEVAFADLEADPMGELTRIYSALRLPEFRTVQPDIERYVASLAGYTKNPPVSAVGNHASRDYGKRVSRVSRLGGMEMTNDE